MKKVLRFIRNKIGDFLWLFISASKENRIENKEVISYICYELQNIKKILRYLAAESHTYEDTMSQTRESFNYQWGNLNSGDNLIDDDSFLTSVGNTITNYTQLPKEWFVNKKIIDAGCGSGRFSFGLNSLGAKVTSFDQSKHGVEELSQMISKHNLEIEVFQQNIFEPINIEKATFDLVWSYGVLHHTGNTYKAFFFICFICS